jgi:hypothetical protein
MRSIMPKDPGKRRPCIVQQNTDELDGSEAKGDEGLTGSNGNELPKAVPSGLCTHEEGAMKRLYPDFGHPNGIGMAPWFSIQDGKLYPEVGHPNGKGTSPWFVIRNEQVYPDVALPQGPGEAPWFRIRDLKLFPDSGNPDGASDAPWYSIR